MAASATQLSALAHCQHHSKLTIFLLICACVTCGGGGGGGGGGGASDCILCLCILFCSATRPNLDIHATLYTRPYGNSPMGGLGTTNAYAQ